MIGKNSHLAIVVVACMAAGAAAEPSPSDPAGSLEAGIYVGGFISNSRHQFFQIDLISSAPDFSTVSPEVGGRFGWFLHRFVGIEMEGGIVLTSTKGVGDSVSLYRLRAQLVGQIPGRFTPFVVAGASAVFLDDDMLGHDSDFPIHAGIGARYYVTPRLALRADFRLLRGPSNALPTPRLDATYGEFSVGVSFNPLNANPAPARNPDPDGDGVLGESDLCPDVAANTADGCPIKDTDGDGIMDPDDACPNQAETVNTYKDTDGCPDERPDTDGDKIFDDEDKCPTQAEDMDGFEDSDGCPELDNDKDGVVDTADSCPIESGPVENRGCPDKDRDNDGIVDRLDNCPDEAGTAKNFGCKAKQLVTITQTQLKILDKVFFATNKAKIEKRSNKLLDNIASVLSSHPEIKKIRIEGHTDDQGDDVFNKNLSQSRASAVAKYLEDKGVAVDRMEAVGFGEEKPVGDNKTAKGREQNRRVEFNIVDPAPAPAPAP